MITKYNKDSILNTELKYIAHGVNCKNRMGSGVAKVLFDKYPDVKTEYHKFCKNLSFSPLNYVQSINCNDKVVFNCFTQENYGYDGKRYVNYGAIVKCFTNLVERGITKLAIPKIGCGLAGGDWNIVEQLINDTVGENIEIWVYDPNLEE